MASLEFHQERLLRKGADLNAKAKKVVISLKFADSEGHAEIVKILKQAGAAE